MVVSEQLVTFERRGGIAIITLNRPDARNAVNEDVSTLMEQHLDTFESDDELSVAILRSSGTVFCAGADLKAVGSGGRLTSRKGGFCGLSYPRRKLLIGAVDGDALAGGCELALGCDMIVASHRARFGVPEVKRSLVPTGGGVVLLPRVLPRRVAMEMIVTGDPISAERAHHFGLVNTITDDGAAFEGALTLAERITVNAPIAVTLAAQATRDGVRLDEAGAWELSAAAGRANARSEDFAEGPRAFAEKRAPKWSGRMRPKFQADYASDSGELLRKDIETVRERGSAVPIVLRTLRHEANAALPKL